MSAAHAIELSSVPTMTLDCKLPNSESKYTSLSLLQEEIERRSSGPRCIHLWGAREKWGDHEFSGSVICAGGRAHMFLMAGRTFDLTSSGRFSCQVRVTLPTYSSSTMSHLCHRARARDHRTRV